MKATIMLPGLWGSMGRTERLDYLARSLEDLGDMVRNDSPHVETKCIRDINGNTRRVSVVLRVSALGAK